MNIEEYAATNRPAPAPDELRLYCDDLHVASVVPTGGEFPWLHGIYTLAIDGTDTRLSRSIREYIRFSEEDHRLATDPEADPDGSLHDKFIEDNVGTYDDYCEDREWRLVDSNGKETMIMCPGFEHEEGLSWTLQ